MTLVASTVVPSASSGSPSRTPSTRASVRTTPRSARSARFTRSIGPPWNRISSISLRPIGVRRVTTCRHAKSSIGKTTCIRRDSSRIGISPQSRPASVVGWVCATS